MDSLPEPDSKPDPDFDHRKQAHEKFFANYHATENDFLQRLQNIEKKRDEMKEVYEKSFGTGSYPVTRNSELESFDPEASEHSDSDSEHDKA